MKIDRAKAAVWVLIILLIASVLVFRGERKERAKLAAAPPVAEVVEPAAPPPAPTPAPAPVAPPPPAVEPRPAPAVTAPVTKARPRPPAPKAVKQAPPAPLKCGGCRKKGPPLPVKDRRNTAKCALVPAEAYNHSTFMVVGAAKERGITPDAMVVLKWCIGA